MNDQCLKSDRHTWAFEHCLGHWSFPLPPGIAAKACERPIFSPVKPQEARKLIAPRHLAALRDDVHAAGRTLVLCHGCFDIVHPGHLRYLQFARRQGDLLIVSITGDDAIEKADGTRPYVPQELRAESLAALECVDHVVIADAPTAEPIIRALRPHVYIKGKEYEHSTDPRFLAEKQLVEQLEGRVIYSSGEVVYSSSRIIDTMGEAIEADAFTRTQRLAACCSRWGLDRLSLHRTISGAFVGKRVAVVGDAVLDRYAFCETVDVAGEAPILSVRPFEEKTYFGAAAIIAAHLRSLGASAHLVTTVGDDAASDELSARLDEQAIAHTTFQTRTALPTKLRYLVDQQKLLKVDNAAVQPLDSATQKRLVAALRELADDLDAIIFTDFGYGTITPTLLEAALPMLRPRVPIIAGDVSGARRTLLAMRGFDLLTPTERELRSVLAEPDQSLPTAAAHLMQQTDVPNLAVTLGPRGCVLFRPRAEQRDQWFAQRLRSEYLPSLADHALDPIGAGDAFLAAATLMLTTGATLTQAGYIASAAAALTVNRLGNLPLGRDRLLHWLTTRPELTPTAVADAG